MKIAIVSDTHGNVANFKKAVDWINKNNIQTILHCGDIGDPKSLKESLKNFKGKVFGVLGNMDRDYKFFISEYNNISKCEIKEDTYEIEINKKKIAINHFPEKGKKMAESGKFDLVFYGHTHKPWSEKIKNCKLINPGELAGQIYKPTFAVYDAETEDLDLKILERL
jgi:hypothetical protein